MYTSSSDQHLHTGSDTVTIHFHVRSKVVVRDTNETQSTWEQQISVISLLRPSTCKQDQQQIRYFYNKSEYYDNESR